MDQASGGGNVYAALGPGPWSVVVQALVVYNTNGSGSSGSGIGNINLYSPLTRSHSCPAGLYRNNQLRT